MKYAGIRIECTVQTGRSLVSLLVLFIVFLGGAGAAPSGQDEVGKRLGSLTLSLRSKTSSPRVGEVVSLEVFASTQERILDAPLQLTFDGAVFQFVDAAAGIFLKRDGGGIVFLANGHTRPGIVEIGIGRSNRSRGLKGKGVLCRVRLRVLAPASTKVTISQAAAWNDDHNEVPVTRGNSQVLATR